MLRQFGRCSKKFPVLEKLPQAMIRVAHNLRRRLDRHRQLLVRKVFLFD